MKIKKILIFMCLIFVIFSGVIYSDSNGVLLNDDMKTPSKNSRYSSYEYVIDKYDINMVVNEDNTFDITEVITAYFNVEKHGINRNIPMFNYIKRQDGTTSYNRTKISNISVDNEFKVSKNSSTCNIKIGSKDKLVTGEQTYTISYHYDIGKDPMPTYDELYFNLIGNEWNTIIGNISFTIIMPKEFDESKLGFTYGRIGETNTVNVEYNVNGNVITGTYDGILSSKNGLTVRCELQEGYFIEQKYKANSFTYIFYIIPIVFLIISIYLANLYKKTRTKKEIIRQPYPPEGVNSLDAGYIYKGNANSKDVASLLLYFATKGYLKLSDENDTLKIKKIKEYDGFDENESRFFKGLFDNEILGVEAPTEVTSEQLKDHFYHTNSDILNRVNGSENKNRIFEKESLSKIKFVILMLIITFFAISTPLILASDYREIPSIMLSPLAFVSIIVTLYFVMIYNGVNVTFARCIVIGLSCIIFIPFYLFIVTKFLANNLILSLGYLVGIFCIIGMLICIGKLNQRTEYGNDIYLKLLGMQQFIKTATKEELEEILIQNPNYFYDILPYANILKISNVWIEKFNLVINYSFEMPMWYDGRIVNDLITFNNILNYNLSKTISNMTYDSTSYDSSSYGGSSGGGGGSSGGGSGGGGGSSW